MIWIWQFYYSLTFKTSQCRQPQSDCRLCKILTGDILGWLTQLRSGQRGIVRLGAAGTRLSLGVAACYSSLSPSWFFVRLFPVFILHIAIFGFGYQTIGIISKLFPPWAAAILMLTSISTSSVNTERFSRHPDTKCSHSAESLKMTHIGGLLFLHLFCEEAIYTTLIICLISLHNNILDLAMHKHTTHSKIILEFKSQC